MRKKNATTCISESFFNGEGYVRPNPLTPAVVLCETLTDPPEFVRFLLDDEAGSASYRRLLQLFESLGESPSWFWGLDPDNCLSVLSGVQAYDHSQPPDDRLQHFAATESIQGGQVWLGLVGAGRRWLLFHEFSPGNELVISVHGQQELCESAAVAFGAVTERGPRWAVCGSARAKVKRDWRTATVVALARQVKSGDYGALAILADALQDCGCESEEILQHCRSPFPHGCCCWVADAVIGGE